MKTVTLIGLDIAKSVFQVHGIDAAGKAVIRKQLKRARVIPFFMKLPPCLVGIEACASSHHWARELTALGHEVKLSPPAYVKPYGQAAEERCCRCRGNLRGGAAPQHAVRAHQAARTASRPGAAPDAASPHPPANCGHELDQGTSCRVRDRRPSGTQRRGCIDCHRQ